MNDKATSYLLWAMWLFGFAGLHRIYNRKYLTGIIWFFTWGLFGIGQLIDLVLIPGMVDEYNYRRAKRLGLHNPGNSLPQDAIHLVISQGNTTHATTTTNATPQPPAELTEQDMMLKLLKAAQSRSGKLTVTQAVLDTELSFEQVEKTLRKMVKTGYVETYNDPETGMLTYDFLEL
jgi:TM2 domain-containing membrane protein YozV